MSKRLPNYNKKKVKKGPACMVKRSMLEEVYVESFREELKKIASKEIK